jgi:phenylpyruvate tautomerase PptA (4-oxalocrotonate tautomerase family)
MPIVDVEIVLRPGETIHSEIVTELANELGEILHSPPRGTWIKVCGFPAGHYAENGGTPDGVYPVFVSILRSKLPDLANMEKEVEKITGAVAHICGRSSENVHVIYRSEGRGRVAFGGRLVL